MVHGVELLGPNMVAVCINVPATTHNHAQSHGGKNGDKKLKIALTGRENDSSLLTPLPTHPLPSPRLPSLPPTYSCTESAMSSESTALSPSPRMRCVMPFCTHASPSSGCASPRCASPGRASPGHAFPGSACTAASQNGCASR
ncbi:unnamed protein product [Closterium sp. NIES-53]